MDAKICDRCGVLWKDHDSCKFQITTIYMSKGTSHSDNLGNYDLCDSCKKELFDFLKPIPLCINDSHKTNQ